MRPSASFTKYAGVRIQIPLVSTFMKPLLSIVTIVKDDLLSLRYTSENVWRHRSQEVEHLIIDGASTDGCREYAAEHASQLSYWVSEKDSGISDAFNKGWKAATGEWILFLNAGDVLLSDGFQKVLNRLSTCQADVLYANMQTDEKTPFVIQADHHLLTKEMSLNHPATLVRRSCFEEAGGFNLNYRAAMDFEFFLKLQQAGKKFEHLDATLSLMNLNGVSHVNWKKGFLEVRRAKEEIMGANADAKSYYWKQVFAYLTQHYLKKLGLTGLVRFYRSRFSRIRKTSA